MTREEKVRALVLRYARYYGLDDWDIEVYFAPPNEEARASCHADPEYQEAKLIFALHDIPPDKDERHVRHELFHAVVWPLFHVAQSLADEDAFKQEMVRLAHEQVVTAVEKWPLWEEYGT